jgi:hydroxyethylthiazole kinase
MIYPGTALAEMRAKAPLVHCITNYVAMQRAADALLAAGASPAMVHAPEEAGAFAAVADALTVNIGTISAHWLEGMLRAVEAAHEAGKPWALDPVALYASPWRTEAALRLAAMKPTAIRGNASEIIALAGEKAAGKGADSADSVKAAETVARRLARRTGAVIAVTGPVDFVTDGKRAARVRGGSALMPKVTALGCALTGVLGAFLAAVEDPYAATVGALAYYARAGERAAETATGPGSFAAAFMDALAAVDPADLSAHARVGEA